MVLWFQVRERDLPMVMHTLSSEFTLLRVVNGETVAANYSGVTNGFVKPKLGKKFFTCTGASGDTICGTNNPHLALHAWIAFFIYLCLSLS